MALVAEKRCEKKFEENGILGDWLLNSVLLFNFYGDVFN
jgi:hypothetical protein